MKEGVRDLTVRKTKLVVIHKKSVHYQRLLCFFHVVVVFSPEEALWLSGDSSKS